MREATVALVASFCAAINRSNTDVEVVEYPVRVSTDGADWGLRPYWSGLQDPDEDGLGRSGPGDSSSLFVFQCL